MTRDIHDPIELFTRKRRETVRSVAVDANEAGTGCNWTRDTSCGARHVMAGGAGMGGNRSSEKLAAAENQ
jgi:hypothetical protein